MPLGRAGHAGLIEVAVLVAARALHADDAVIVRAACDRRLMRGHLHPLRGHVTVRVAIGAPWMEKDPARLEKECARPVFLVRNDREVGDGVELVGRERRQARNVARSACGRDQEGRNQAETKEG